MTCPLCGQRKARRACPALGKQICAVCCGTKRRVEIQCPNDCVYLATAREHPPAVAVRQQQHDVAALVRFMRDLNEGQSRLFFLVVAFVRRYQPPEFQTLIDDDVADATAALAATYETASRGVIYEHRPTSRSAERLANELKPLLADTGERGGAAFRRDAAVVLRRVETAARESAQSAAGNRRAFVELLGRVIGSKDPEGGTSDESDRAPRVIIP